MDLLLFSLLIKINWVSNVWFVNLMGFYRRLSFVEKMVLEYGEFKYMIMFLKVCEWIEKLF